MKILVEKLAPLLAQKACGFFFCSGSEAFLVNEVSDAIVAAAKKQGFTVISRYYAEPGFSFEKIYETLLTPSLFCPKIAAVIQLTQWKLDEKAREILLTLSNKPRDDLLIILKGPKLDKTISNTKWFQQLTEKNYWIDLPAVPAVKLPDWIWQRAARFALSLTREQTLQLAKHTENNLFAAAEAIEKLSLVNQPITNALLLEVVDNSAEYDVFKLIDACLAEEATRCFMIVNTLKNSGTEPLLLIGAWARELRLLLGLLDATAQKVPLNTAAHALGIWPSRLPLMQRFIQRNNQEAIERYLTQLAQLDAVAKGAAAGNIWHELFRFCMSCGGNQCIRSA